MNHNEVDPYPEFKTADYVCPNCRARYVKEMPNDYNYCPYCDDDKVSLWSHIVKLEKQVNELRRK